VIILSRQSEDLQEAADELAKEVSADDKKLIDKSLEKDPTALAGLGLESLDMSLFPPPRVIVVQYSTKGAETPSGKEIPAGKIWNKATGKIYDELPCAMLKAGVTRARFEKGEFDKGPLCLSRNGLVGSEGQSCLECPYSKWTEEPPECRMSIEFLAQSDEGELFIIRFSGTSFKNAQQFINNVRYSKMPIFAHKVVLETEKQESAKGKYFELKIRIMGKRDKSEIEKLLGDYEQFGRDFMPAITEGEVKED